MTDNAAASSTDATLAAPASSSSPPKAPSRRSTLSPAAAAAAAAKEDSTEANAAATSNTAPSAAADDDAAAADEEEVASSSYTKALRSDVSIKLAFQLLSAIAAKDAAYRDFSTADLRKIAAVLSVLIVPAGETIIAKGEDATFCAIILDGAFNAVVSPTLSVPLRRGALVGEMALFEGGVRNADIVCSEEAVLAVISFSELTELGLAFPMLMRNLMLLFAAASIKKLRRPGWSPAQIAENARKDEEEAAIVQARREAQNAAAAAAAAAGGAPAVDNTASKRKEFLYRTRIEREEKAAAAAAAASPAAAGATVAGFAALDAKSSDLSRAKSKAAKAEKNAKNEKLRLDHALKKIEKYTALLDERDVQVEALTQEIEKRKKQIASLERKITESNTAATKLQAQLAAETQARAEVEQRLSQVTANVTREVESRFDPQLVALKAEVSRSKSTLESTTHHLKKTAEEHLKLLDSNRQLADTVQQVTAMRNTLYSELHDERRKKDALETLSQQQEKMLLTTQAALKVLETKAAETEERHNALLPWKNKALEATQAIEAEKTRAARAVDSAFRGKQELEEDRARYHKLLRLVVVGTFCRESRLRKALATTHGHVSDMLLMAMEENINVSGQALPGAPADSGNSPSNATPSAIDGAIAPTESPSVAGVVVMPLSRPSLKSIKKRQHAYLSTLLTSRSKPREIVASLDDEVAKLRTPLNELLERCRHWKATSESFCQRSIELTNEKDDLAASLAQTTNKIEAIKSMLQSQQEEHEQLCGRNNELTRANAQLEKELEKIQTKFGIVPTSPEGSSSGGGGSTAGNTKEKDSPAASSHPRGSHGHGSHGGKGNHAAAASALEALQLQQQALLQSNIQQLQAHYAHLLAAVQGFNGRAPPPPIPAAAMGHDGMQQSASQAFIPPQQQQYQHHHSDEKQEASPQQQQPALMPYSQSQSQAYLHPSSGLHSSSASHAYLSPSDPAAATAGGSAHTSPRRSASSRASHVSSYSNLHSHAGLEAYMMGVQATRQAQQPQHSQQAARAARRTHQTQTPLQPLQVYLSPRKPAATQHAQPPPQQQPSSAFDSTAGFSPRVGLAVNPSHSSFGAAAPPAQQPQHQPQSHRSSGVFLPPVAPTPVSHNGSAAASSAAAVSPSTVLLTVRGR